MISFKEYREKAIAIRESKQKRKHNPEKHACDAAFERILIKRFASGVEATEAFVDIRP